MPLRKYAAFCDGMIEELGAGWSEERLQKLAASLHAMTYDKWRQWRTDHAGPVHKLLASGPGPQRKLLEKAEEPDLLRLAAIQSLYEAQVLLRNAAELADMIGTSYRTAVSDAAERYQLLKSQWPAYPTKTWGYPECLIVAVRVLFPDPE